MNPRQKQILSALIDDYVKEVKPISSNFLVEQHHLDFSPATVRNELAQLLAEGYLRKIYFSSGNLPTNKAYRFLVEQILGEEVLAAELEFGLEPEIESLSELVKLLSRQLGLLTAGIDQDLNLFVDGLEELFNQPDFETRVQYLALGRVVDFLREAREEIFKKAENLPAAMFVGRKNPFYQGSDELSWLVSGPGENCSPGVLISIGPTRMFYKKNWQTFCRLKDCFFKD
ncbi:MAG: hypothetical protein AB1721_00630 [Patescibacteria group bacterium]